MEVEPKLKLTIQKLDSRLFLKFFRNEKTCRKAGFIVNYN